MVDNKEEEVELTLDTLPIEVFLHITKFIPASDLINSLSLVSKHFYEVINNEKTWEIRAKKKWGGQFPPVPIPEDQVPSMFHRLSTLKREETARLWSQDENKSLTFSPHIACVDAVLLYKGNSMLLSGSRDRSIALINVDKCIVEGKAEVEMKKENAHGGWIWDFCTLNQGETIASAGWDAFIKLWDGRMMEETGAIKTTAPALCLSTDTINLLVTGTFDSKLHLIDARTMERVKQYNCHKRSVLSVGLENGKIVSAGEDNRVVLNDVRMTKSISTLQLPQLPSPNPAETSLKLYPKSISFAKTSAVNPLPYFYVGDIRGNLYLVDLTTFKIEKTYPRIHSKAIQGVYHTIGGVYTCSSDGMLLVHDSSTELRTVKKICLEKVELPKVHCLNNRVALAGADSLVRVYYN